MDSRGQPHTKELWAPDISYFNGKFHLYYAYSAFGVNTSGIALATNETLDPAEPALSLERRGPGSQIDEARQLQRHRSEYRFDTKGQPWLSFGSFWGGIKMRRIDPVSGQTFVPPIPRSIRWPHERSLEMPEPAKPGLPPDWEAIEAPFIVRHGGYYYLFVSFDLCCRGTRSNYRTMVSRSRTVTGPYPDENGKPMLDGGGTQLLAANSRWLGPGGESILQRPEGDIIVFHAYDASTGKPALQISTHTWKHGWPHAAVGTTGESK